jgi:hypothetical protein
VPPPPHTHIYQKTYIHRRSTSNETAAESPYGQSGSVGLDQSR